VGRRGFEDAVTGGRIPGVQWSKFSGSSRERKKESAVSGEISHSVARLGRNWVAMVPR